MRETLEKYISFRFIKFCIVGIINTLINYYVFFILLKFLSIDYRIAGCIGFLSGAISGFFLNRGFTFKSNVNISSGITKYLLIQVFCMGAHLLTIVIAKEIFKVPEVYSQFAGIVVTTFLNYSFIKRIVFEEVDK